MDLLQALADDLERLAAAFSVVCGCSSTVWRIYPGCRYSPVLSRSYGALPSGF
jgi:hypothetical protein